MSRKKTPAGRAPTKQVKKPAADKPKGNSLYPKTRGQAEFIRTIAENELTICIAPAGTGKTHISVGMACEYLQDKDRGISKIIITRPLIQCGPGMGHLPGTVEAKADPFMGPIFDALDYFLTPDRAQAYLKNGTIKVVPLEIMRGANMHNTFVILDEMQNCSYMQLKMFATRLGENSKCIISGDLKQSDLDKRNFNNSQIIQENFIDKLKGADSIGYCELGIDDIVRSGISRTCITRLP
jgi:phosphate starvation-inducible PhoH-like protein